MTGISSIAHDGRHKLGNAQSHLRPDREEQVRTCEVCHVERVTIIPRGMTSAVPRREWRRAGAVLALQPFCVPVVMLCGVDQHPKEQETQAQ